MASLKDVAERAEVPILAAYHALQKDDTIDETISQRVAQAAEELSYKLKITQIDVADLAGVGKGTVSYALNGNDLIKPATRQKVIEAAQALNYRPNIMARNLKTNRAGIVGYSWHVHDDPNRMNNLLDEFIYRVTMAAEAEHYHLLTFIQPQEDPERVYDELISTNRVDGFIFSDIRYEDPRIQRLTKLKAPFVAFGGMYLPEVAFAYVDVDGKKGIEMTVEHLLSMGHERIGLVNWHPGTLIGDVREAGYHNAMENAGISVLPDWVAYTPNIMQSASEATAQLMAAKHAPTAIVCTNDVMAFGAKAYLDEMGYRDVALTGYDDDPTAQFLGITSVRQPIAAVAQTLFDILLGEIEGTPRPQRQVAFDPELVVRSSTAF
ncbi:substrate-binding domain-containing protein [Phototrophicus methaneseepsis]|uniref:Substrate-binding domain-containing protein n=1 Tax=Phototrophicus methaneseepsis TaxID=2710758 RepID=A0A7S8EAF7_9CHLR|nr:substrate-binding domain-containing protein [Phototrophicus methaneseepsis]QPC83327.1 substrate-binding domain-containing protein [Phototrophicus methaneseepsis]